MVGAIDIAARRLARKVCVDGGQHVGNIALRRSVEFDGIAFRRQLLRRRCGCRSRCRHISRSRRSCRRRSRRSRRRRRSIRSRR